MAIKVNGTTVIDDSRNITNIAGGFKTVNGTSVVGSGDISAGASTTYGAVGTYAWGRPRNGTGYGFSSTSSSVYAVSSTGGVPYWDWYGNQWIGTYSTNALSGTWRHMGNAGTNSYSQQAPSGLWVRIS